MADGNVHYEDPFATPADKREPARRLRGRLAAPVTIWTSGDPGNRSGLTVSSILVAEGAPSLVLGLISDTAEVYETLKITGSCVVHLLDHSHRIVADQFAGLRPSPGGLFVDQEIEDTEWGPALASFTNRAYCRYLDDVDSGYQRLVRASIERIELEDLDHPLIYFRGRYRSLGPEGRAGGTD